MANFYGVARSSYFLAKDEEKWYQYCERWGLTSIDKVKDGQRLHGFMTDQRDDGLPSACQEFYDDETEDEGDFFFELSEQIAPGWVAIVQEIGNEKFRYLSGLTWIVSQRGILHRISIGDYPEIIKRDEVFYEYTEPTY